MVVKTSPEQTVCIIGETVTTGLGFMVTVNGKKTEQPVVVLVTVMIAL